MNLEAKNIGWNWQRESTCGGPATQIMGCNFIDTLVHTESREERKADFDYFRKTGQWRLGHRLYETTGYHQDGHEIPVEVNITPIHVGHSYIFNAFIRDISARKRAEAELACERDLLKTLMDNSPEVICFKDRQSRFVRVSKSFARQVDVGDLESLLGKTDFDFFADESARPAYENEQQIIRTGEHVLGKVEKQTHADGRLTWALTSKLPWR